MSAFMELLKTATSSHQIQGTWKENAEQICFYMYCGVIN
jgi:uncharacterized Zn-finger protein